MHGAKGNAKGYLFVAAVGVIGGGLAVVVATRAVPRMMGAMMAGMMRQMMSAMAEQGCSPAEI